MVKIKYDEKGFTCECGVRNDYPGYVRDHWSVKLVYSCPCKRQFVLYRGTVTMISQPPPEYMDSESFGD
jgi:hypothetical protein